MIRKKLERDNNLSRFIVSRVNVLFARADAVEREVAAATKRAEVLARAFAERP
jgi:hypothetical protein